MSVADPYLVIVHPGEACVVAKELYGTRNAKAYRDEMARDISEWSGHVIVLDNLQTEEVESYSDLYDAIESALEKAEHDGLTALRIVTPETDVSDWTDIVEEKIAALKANHDAEFSLTGAFYFANDEGGSINAVRDVIDGLGFSTEIEDSAMQHPDGVEIEDENEDDDNNTDEEDY